MKKLISIMTKKEQDMLITKTFDELWNTIWVDTSGKCIKKYKKNVQT